jgi:hypothetical protein
VKNGADRIERATRIDTVEVCGSSPHGLTILFSDLASKPSFDKAPNGSIKDAVRSQQKFAV